MPGAALNRGASRQDWETPDDFIVAVKRKLGIRHFAIDLAADATNAKAEVYFCDQEGRDALDPERDWARACRHNWAWLNPPYGDLRPWVARCSEEAFAGAKIALLVPAAVGSRWFEEYVHNQALVLAVTPRVRFVGAKDDYPKDLILALYGPLLKGFDVWRWK